MSKIAFVLSFLLSLNSWCATTTSEAIEPSTESLMPSYIGRLIALHKEPVINLVVTATGDTVYLAIHKEGKFVFIDGNYKVMENLIKMTDLKFNEAQKTIDITYLRYNPTFDGMKKVRSRLVLDLKSVLAEVAAEQRADLGTKIPAQRTDY